MHLRDCQERVCGFLDLACFFNLKASSANKFKNEGIILQTLLAIRKNLGTQL